MPDNPLDDATLAALLRAHKAQQEHGLAFRNAMALVFNGWQAIETKLYYMVHCILGTEQDYSAAMFYAIRSPQTKVQIAETLWRIRLTKKEFDQDAKPIFKTVDRLRQERDNVAHFQAQGFIDQNGRQSTRLYWNYHDPSFGKMLRHQYEREDLTDVFDEMRQASNDLSQLTRKHYPSSEAWPKTPAGLHRKRPNKRSQAKRDREG